MTKRRKKALLLGAGGPLGALEAGALIALDEKGVRFDVIAGACIGSIQTLAYASPAKGMSGKEALELWCEGTGLSDAIYRHMPVNYKVFQRDAGPLSTLWDAWARWMMTVNPMFHQAPGNDLHRLYCDLYLLGLSLWAPMVVTSNSDSIGRIYADNLDAVIDFEKLKDVEPEVYINALDVSRKTVALFDKGQITRKHAVAGSSLYYITPQQQIDGVWYAEGSYVDCLNYKGVLERHPDVDTLVVMNILNKEDLIRRPKDLYDAYNLSVMLPFITIAEDDTKLFEAKHKGDRTLLKVPFDIPEQHTANALDWSASNFRRLRDIGYRAGLDFYEAHQAELA